MICANCTASLDANLDTCSFCGQTPFLGGKYRILEPLRTGNLATLYSGQRVSDGLPVALKVLSFKTSSAEKYGAVQQKEAKTLEALNHPSIPRYLEHFTLKNDDVTSFVSVQMFVQGTSLKEELNVQAFREDEVARVLIELLAMLTYLHTLSPPVLQRDIKPSTVMRRGSDRKLLLVGFGSELDRIFTPKDQRPVLAPEVQVGGEATPKSDLYSLGVLAVVLWIVGWILYGMAYVEGCSVWSV